MLTCGLIKPSLECTTEAFLLITSSWHHAVALAQIARSRESFAECSGWCNHHVNHNTLRKLVVVVGGLGVRSVALEIFVSIDGVGLISLDQ